MTDHGDTRPEMVIEPIGVIRTGHAERSTTPVQSSLNPDDTGRVELDPRYHDGLAGLHEFDAVWLLTWLGAEHDARASISMRQVPFLLTATGRELGLFAMRGPRRPNPIGLSLVRLVEVEPAGFVFAGVDMVDGTPLLDVKPYVARFDVPPGVSLDGPVRSGWFDGADMSAPHTPASLSGDPPGAAR